MYQHNDICWGDTETRSECDLMKHGAFNYATHPSTEIIMIQWAFNNGPVQIWETGDPLPFDLFQWIEQGKKVAFHNATFDYLIFKYANIKYNVHYTVERSSVPMHSLVKLHASQLVDTMAWAAASDLPQKLDTLCKVLNLPEEYRKTAGMAPINKFCKPRKPTKNNIDRWWTSDTAPEQWSDFRVYGEHDIKAMREAASYMPALTEYEQGVWQHTLTMNMRGVPVDVQECRKVMAIVEQEKGQLNREAVAIGRGAFNSVTEKEKVKLWMKEAHNFTILNEEGKLTLAKEFVDKALAGIVPEEVRKVLEISKAVNQTSVKKFDKIVEVACHDGTVKGTYIYHGANTGRYASRGGLNLQNLKRPVIKNPEKALELLTSLPYPLVKAVYPSLMDAATSCIRSVIRAPEGFEFINEDFASIENRVANWIAGQLDIVAGYEKGLDEYLLLAVDMFDVAYEEVTKDQRQIAKAGVLGGQFGQGYLGMITFAEGYGVELTVKKSRELIKAYRGTHPEIVSMWYELGDMCIDVISSPGLRLSCRGRVTVFMCPLNLFLCLELPSGRIIKWFKPRISMRQMPICMTEEAGEFSYEEYLVSGWTDRGLIGAGLMKPRTTRKTIIVTTKKKDGHAWYEQPLIGSSIFQSAVQGIARDLMVNSMLNLESGGYPVVMTTHDEAMALTPIGEKSIEEFDNIFCQLPVWAGGLPVAGDAWQGERHRK